MISVSISIAVILSSLLLSGLFYILKKRRHFLSNNAPLFAPFSMFENLKATMTRAGLMNLKHIQKCSRTFNSNQLGVTKCGRTFRVQRPRVSEVLFGSSTIYTSDYRLARMILAGDEESGVVEGEKASMLKVLNFIDRSCSNMLTDATSSETREKSRKTVAQSFSKINLMKTWPYLEEVIIEQFNAFRNLQETGELLNVKDAMMCFFFSTLFRSSFAVPVNMDGIEREDSINGRRYMEEQEIAARERPREIILPLRRYWFWSPEVRRCEEATNYLKHQAEKVLRLHEKGGNHRDGKASLTLLDHIVQYSYSSELRRVSDMNIMIFGGHETTAVTFCSLIMELARNPEIKKKLQKELAEVMPSTPPSTSNHQQHGDTQLISKINNLEYLNMCIKEVLRMWPASAGGMVRDVTRDVHYEGMIIPKGSAFVSHAYSIMREEWIERAEEFLPERWSENNPQLAQLKEAYIPFSLGRRNCVGQNMAYYQLRLVTAYFFHYFDFELIGEPSFEYFITLKPHFLQCKVTERIHAK